MSLGYIISRKKSNQINTGPYAWCETSTDFDLLVELIAHALADEETSTIQVAHHQSVARQKCKLVADFGVRMHLAWAHHL